MRDALYRKGDAVTGILPSSANGPVLEEVSTSKSNVRQLSEREEEGWLATADGGFAPDSGLTPETDTVAHAPVLSEVSSSKANSRRASNAESGGGFVPTAGGDDAGRNTFTRDTGTGKTDRGFYDARDRERERLLANLKQHGVGVEDEHSLDELREEDAKLRNLLKVDERVLFPYLPKDKERERPKYHTTPDGTPLVPHGWDVPTTDENQVTYLLKHLSSKMGIAVTAEQLAGDVLAGMFDYLSRQEYKRKGMTRDDVVREVTSSYIDPKHTHVVFECIETFPPNKESAVERFIEITLDATTSKIKRMRQVKKQYDRLLETLQESKTPREVPVTAFGAPHIQMLRGVMRQLQNRLETRAILEWFTMKLNWNGRIHVDRNMEGFINILHRSVENKEALKEARIEVNTTSLRLNGTLPNSEAEKLERLLDSAQRRKQEYITESQSLTREFVNYLNEYAEAGTPPNKAGATVTQKSPRKKTLLQRVTGSMRFSESTESGEGEARIPLGGLVSTHLFRAVASMFQQ